MAEQKGIGEFTVLLESSPDTQSAPSPGAAAAAPVPKPAAPTPSFQRSAGPIQGPFVSKAAHPELAGVQMSDEGIKTIIAQEGYRAEAYPDAAGYSVGYGHYLGDGDVGKGTKITPHQGLMFLAKDLKGVERYVTGKVTAKLTGDQLAALASFTYNTGSLPSNIAEAVNNGDIQLASAIMRKYIHSRDRSGNMVVNPSLVERRGYETSLLEGKKRED